MGSRWESSAPIRYPDPNIIVLDPRFRHLVVPMAAIERVATGFRFTEGPAYYGDGRYLLFSDIPNDALLRWDEITGAVATLRNPAGFPDGNTRDRQGRLVTCELGSRTLTRTEHDGTVTVLASQFQNTRLTGPNDVVVKSDGSIWFSDNGAGIRGHYLGERAPKEMPYRVYRLDPSSGALTIAIDDMERPNGLCFSPDETLLYINDSPPGDIKVFPVDADGSLGEGRLFFGGIGKGDIGEGTPDGMKCDELGNLWCTGPKGVWVIDPEGELLGIVPTPEVVGNIVWGGEDLKTLLMTTSSLLLSVRTKVAAGALPYH